MKIRKALAAMALFAFMSPAFAGPYTDDLSRCLVEKTTSDDKIALVQWMFVAMSQHPSVASMTKVTAADVEKHNKGAGELFMRLLTDTCGEPFRKAMQFEGANAIASSFEVLGGAAMQDLMSNPQVTTMMSGLEKHFDPEKLAEFAKPQKK